MSGKFIDCDVTLVNNLPDSSEVHKNVINKADSILGRIDALHDTSDDLSKIAENILEKIKSFDVSIDEISYSFELGDYTRAELGQGTPPNVLKDISIDRGSFGDLPSVDVKEFESSSIEAPDAQSFSFPEAPTLPSAGAAPNQSAIGNIPEVPDAPTVEIKTSELLGLPDFTPMVVNEITVPDISLADLDEIDLPPIPESMLDRYENIIAKTPELPDYDEQTAKDGLKAAEALLSGNFILDVDDLELGARLNTHQATERYVKTVSDLWRRRGMPDVREGLADHLHLVRQRVKADLDADRDAIIERWRMRLLPVAIQLNAEAHSFLVDKLNKLLDVEFDILLAEAEARIGLYAAAVAKYRVMLARVSQQVAKYKHKIATIRAELLKYAAEVDKQKAVAKMNGVKAAEYTVLQNVQGVSVDAFLARVDAVKASISAFDAQMRAVQAKAKAIGASLAKYEAESEQWRGELISVRAAYRTRRAENQAIMAQNRAIASQISAEAQSSSAIAFEAVKSAQAVSATAAMLRAGIANRVGEYAKTEINNTQSAMDYKMAATKYRIDAAEKAAEMFSDVVNYTAILGNNSAIARVVSAAAEPVARAAETTQKLQSQLASAYVDLARAAADAEAARLSGKAARIRASTTLSARGTINHTNGVAVNGSFNSSITDSHTNQCIASYKNIYM